MISHKNPHLKAMITQQEGEVLLPYEDSKGNLTIGVGHNLEEHGITQEISQLLLSQDLALTVRDIKVKFKWIEELNEPRQAAIINLVFNMGLPTFLEFEKTIRLIKDKRFKEAGDELLRGSGEGGKSRYYVDVGARAEVVAEMLRTGKWPQ